MPGGDIRLFDIFKNLEVKTDFYAFVKEYVEKAGLLFLATPFGPKSLAVLHSLQPAFVKIASPELNYTALLRSIAAWNIPALLSSGVSRLGDIETALDILDETGTRRTSLCLLHCVTAYPAPPSEYNLSVLPYLQGIFGINTGVSDHSTDSTLIPLLAIAQGAAVIEKHFCLSRSGGGLDDPIALPPAEFAEMCHAVRAAQTLDSAEIIRQVTAKTGDALVQSILGDGIKKLAPAEKANYQHTNRSIHAVRLIQAGEKFTVDNIAVLRTEKILRPGLPPCYYEKLIGHSAGRDIPAGEGVCFEDLP